MGLKRSLTWVQGTSLTIGAVIGCGILILPSITANIAGPASVLVWLCMSIFTFPIVATLSRLVQIIPSAGGITAYVEMAFGRNMSTFLGYMMLGSVPIGAPIVALIGANYVRYMYQLSLLETLFVAAALISVSILLHIKGIEISGKVSMVMVILIVGLLLTSVVVSWKYVDNSYFKPFMPNGYMSIGSAMLIIFFSFVGWEMIVPLAEEFNHPKRDVPISLFSGAVAIMVLYVLLSFVTVGTHSYGIGLDASLSMLMEKQFGAIGIGITTALAVFIAFSTIHANIAGFSRMIYAQARDGKFPAFFATLHPVFYTPVRVLLTFWVTNIVLFILYLFTHPSLNVLLQVSSTIFVTSYLLTMASAMKLLKMNDYGWSMATFSFFICGGICVFSGWSILYPIVLGTMGLVYTKQKQRKDRLVEFNVKTK